MEKLNKHNIITKFCDGLNKGLANSLLIVGSGGLGKTETTLTALKNLQLEKDKHFKYLNTHSSPLEFYNTLDKINDLEEPRILILDDCEEFINDRKILSILRSALWGGLDNKRIVCWNSPKVEKTSFEFTGRIIFLLNKLNLKNNLIGALISRGLYYHLELSNREIINLIKEKAKKPYKNITFKQRIKIVNYLEEIGRNSDKLNLRTLSQAYNLFILSPNHFQTLIAELLK
jgi:hypothetical protein